MQFSVLLFHFVHTIFVLIFVLLLFLYTVY